MILAVLSVLQTPLKICFYLRHRSEPHHVTNAVTEGLNCKTQNALFQHD
jgi:hypothetical protein